jgi:hypothetical protein
MPTGYTADVIEKDISFREFALKCMRAFGALISYRDDDFNKVITEVPLSDYHKRALEKAKNELRLFEKKSQQQLEKLAVEEIKRSYTTSRDSRNKTVEENKKLRKMIAQVKKWKPPTPDHARYKEFMLEQLTISLTDTKYCKVGRMNTGKKAIAEWIKRRIESIEKDVDYHEKYWALDQEGNKEANAWIKAIVESLPQE